MSSMIKNLEQLFDVFKMAFFNVFWILPLTFNKCQFDTQGENWVVTIIHVYELFHFLPKSS